MFERDLRVVQSLVEIEATSIKQCGQPSPSAAGLGQYTFFWNPNWNDDEGGGVEAVKMMLVHALSAASLDKNVTSCSVNRFCRVRGQG